MRRRSFLAGIAAAFAATTVPVGVFAFPPVPLVLEPPVSVLPGWIPCDGRVLSRAAYPRLFKALGTTSADVDSFQLPDLRGHRLNINIATDDHVGDGMLLPAGMLLPFGSL